MNLSNNKFKSIAATLTLGIMGCLRFSFLNMLLAVICGFVVITLYIPGSTVSSYLTSVFGKTSHFLEIMFVILTVVFSTISAWKLGRFAQQRELKRSFFNSVQNSEEALFITDHLQNIIIDNEASRLCFQKLKPNQEVGSLNIEKLESLFDKNSKVIFTRIYENSVACRSDSGELLIKLRGRVDSYWKVTIEPIAFPTEHMLWRIENITDQRAQEIEHLIEEKYLGDLLNQLPVGFFSADGDGNLRYLNSNLRDWLGIREETNVSELPSFMDFISPDVADSDVTSMDASGMHGGLILQNADGEDFPAYLIQSQKESASGYFEYSRSIVLREPFTPLVDDGMGGALLSRLPWLFSDAPVGIVMLDIKGEVTECNRAFLKLLGLHRDGVIGRPLSERISKEDASDADAQLSKVVMGIMPATLLDVRMPAGGERELAASLYVSRITDKDNDVVGLVMHVIDTTEQKNLEVQFNQAQKMQAVGQLAGGVAHDFNNLLTAMGGFCDLLLDRHGSDDPSFSDIMQIKQNTNRAGNLVRQLLAFSRRQTLQPKVFAITDALNDLSNLLRRLIGENITLDINHGKDIDLIRTDPGQFDQVVINLAVNARDAMPGGGLIDISTERVTVETSIQRGHEVMPAGEYILIKVADTGSGIAKEDIGRIFEPFFSTKVVGEGTGLGLSTVYGIIRQSDGYIFVDSAPGNGTTFSLYLPAFSAADADYVGGGYTHEIVDDADLTGGGTILLVEDEDAVRLFGARALRNKGYRVLEANDGEHALDVINEFGDPIDLILTDVMMPGMDGHTLVRLILEELPDIKVILMSGYTEDAIPGEITEDASINFLPKPFSLQELAGKVKEVLLN
ncbi:MAG TPA: PAS domain-containing sensor histidine kinase [Rhodospirillales bacterium]|nr:PAS domain-containing sensor histidine kinase [Rhodospirillales bacterium]HIL76029.1 PAS domain-containing sensor histidine kinase [Rhodospirillales bacterium]